MEFISQYVSKKPDEQGVIAYNDQENATWQRLYQRQLKLLPGRACDEHISGLAALGLTPDAIPQVPAVNAQLAQLTGWAVEPVSALISHQKFFELLAARRFPVATFIRSPEEFDYIKEPDVFHELFGHCPMLTQPVFADFVQAYAAMVLTQPESDWPLLQRLFWFTVEFGLMQTPAGLRAYGGGILSSPGETIYCVESDAPLRVLFEPLSVFRTPYRIDKMQPVYFVIDNYQQLFDCITISLTDKILKARELGELPALFEFEANNPCVHVQAC